MYSQIGLHVGSHDFEAVHWSVKFCQMLCTCSRLFCLYADWTRGRLLPLHCIQEIWSGLPWIQAYSVVFCPNACKLDILRFGDGWVLVALERIFCPEILTGWPLPVICFADRWLFLPPRPIRGLVLFRRTACFLPCLVLFCSYALIPRFAEGYGARQTACWYRVSRRI